MVLYSIGENGKPAANVIGCSVKGPEKPDAKVCEDAHAKCTLSDRIYVIVAADGLGSAKLSEKGASIAANTVVEFLSENLSNKSQLTQSYLENVVYEAFVKTRERLNVEANSRDISVSALNTTLTVAVGGPDGVGGAAVGDGSIVFYKDGSYYTLIPAEGTEYTEETFPIQSESWEDSYRFNWESNVPAATVFTDGLDNIAYDGKDIPSETLFKQFFENIIEFSDLDELESEVEHFLTDGKIKESSGDDKTIVVGSLPEKDWSRLPSEASTNKKQTEGDDEEPSDRPLTVTNEQSNTDAPSDEQSPEADEIVEVESTADKTMQSIREQYSDDTDPETAKAGNSPQKSSSDPHKQPSQSSTVTVESVFGVSEENLPVSVQIGTQQNFVHQKQESATDILLLRTGYQDKHYIHAFDPERRNNNFRRRIEWLVANTQNQDSKARLSGCLWPVSKVTNDGELIGVEIPSSVDLQETIDIHSYINHNRFTIPRNFLRVIRRSIAKVLQSDLRSPQEAVSFELAKLVRDIHQKGCAIGDLSPAQIQVDSNENTYFTRADKFHINDEGTYLPGSKPLPRYAPPESGFQSIEAVQQADRFGLAIHIFEAIIGIHPFARGKSDQNSTWASKEQFILNNKQNVDDRYWVRFKVLPKVYQRLFRESLVAGLDDPEQRPTAKEWVEKISNR